MPESEPNTDGAGSGGESGQANSGPGGGSGYDKWYNVGKSIEQAKNEGKSY